MSVCRASGCERNCSEGWRVCFEHLCVDEADCNNPAFDNDRCEAHGGEPWPVGSGLSKPVPGRKLDDGKARWGLLPFKATALVVDVLTYGARKYEPENWRRVENPGERYFDAAMRHLTAWKQGEEIDPESGKPHLAHAGCCVLFMLELEETER